eukprot:428722_1
MGNRGSNSKPKKAPKSEKSKEKVKKQHKKYVVERTRDITLAEHVAEDDHSHKTPKHAPVGFASLINSKFGLSNTPGWANKLWSQVEKFLIHESAPESFLFLHQMHALKQLYAADPTHADTSNAIKTQMTKIYNDYIKPGSKFEVNLSYDVRAAFTGETMYAAFFMGGEPKYDWVGNTWIKTGTLTDPTTGLWATAEGEVTALILSNKWGPFKQSNYYSDWLAMEDGGKAWIKAGSPTMNFARQEEYNNYLDWDDSFDDYLSVQQGLSGGSEYMNGHELGGYDYYNEPYGHALGYYNGYESSSSVYIVLLMGLLMMLCCGLVLVVSFICCAVGYVFGGHILQKNKNEIQDDNKQDSKNEDEQIEILENTPKPTDNKEENGDNITANPINEALETINKRRSSSDKIDNVKNDKNKTNERKNKIIKLNITRNTNG